MKRKDREEQYQNIRKFYPKGLTKRKVEIDDQDESFIFRLPPEILWGRILEHYVLSMPFGEHHFNAFVATCTLTQDIAKNRIKALRKSNRFEDLFDNNDMRWKLILTSPYTIRPLHLSPL